MSELILALDIGTSAVKASYINAELTVLAEASVPYPSFYPAQGQAEQDPKDWWKAACTAAGQVAEQLPSGAAQVSAIGLSGHMLGLLPVDAKGGPLTASFIHSDRRAEAQAEFLEKNYGADSLYRLTGNVLNATATICKALWLKEQEPALYEKTACFLQAKDYLLLKLTGDVFSTDYSDASHGMLLDLRHMSYASDLMRDLGLEEDKFPPLHKSHDVVGVLSAAAANALGLRAGIPVTAGGGDGACASAGAGLAKAGDIYCSLGTTAWIAFNSERPLFDEKRRLFNIVALDGENSGLFGTTQCAGRAVEWVKDLFAVENFADFNREAAAAPPASDGLVFLPYLEGERSPIFDARARGVFFGMDIAHERRHFLRSAFEGVAFALQSILALMEAHCPNPQLRLIGGGAKSELWREIIADICQRDIVELAVPASAVTSLGAAIAAAVGTGIFSSYEAAAQQIRIRRVTAWEEARSAQYAGARRKFTALYPQLKEIYRL